MGIVAVGFLAWERQGNNQDGRPSDLPLSQPVLVGDLRMVRGEIVVDW